MPRTGNEMIPKLIPLTPEDSDVFQLKMMHEVPSVAKFLSISDNYFNYVTSTNGVTYYKIYCDDAMVGGIHCEKSGDTMYLSIFVGEKWRRMGVAEAALNQLFFTQTDGINVVEVNIHENNFPSLALFEKLGFTQTGKEEELITLQKTLSVTNPGLPETQGRKNPRKEQEDNLSAPEEENGR